MQFLGLLTGMGDYDHGDDTFDSFDANDNVALKEVVRKYVVPYVNKFTPESISKLKLTLRYYLSSESGPWERTFDSLMPPFAAPKNPRDYFVCVWHECFPGETSSKSGGVYCRGGS